MFPSLDDLALPDYGVKEEISEKPREWCARGRTGEFEWPVSVARGVELLAVGCEATGVATTRHDQLQKMDGGAGAYCIDNLSPFWLFRRHSSGLKRVSTTSPSAAAETEATRRPREAARMVESFMVDERRGKGRTGLQVED